MFREDCRRRLTGPGAFERVLRAGERSEGQYLQLVSMPKARPAGRVGFVIGGKALPRAVDRNRVRRMLRVVLREARPVIDEVDLVVRLKRAVPRNEFPRVVQEAVRMLATLPAPGGSR